MRLEGIALSHPDKPYFPEAGIRKRDVAQFVDSMAPWILPHIAGRPLSLVRCPDGWSRPCFFQKHADPRISSAVARITVPEKAGSAIYMGANSAKALVALVQWGVVEIHPWGARSPRLDRPDRLVFDLDPDDGVPWSDLVAAIRFLRTRLQQLELISFLKTTGGKGLHVVVPVRADMSWAAAKDFTKAVSERMAADFPGKFTTVASKARRAGRIFIDYLRNTAGATAVAPYSVRARAGAPVATPVDWDELATDIRFDHFNLRNIHARVAARPDPWREFFSVRQRVTVERARRLGIEWSR